MFHDTWQKIQEAHKNAVREWRLKLDIAEDDDTTPLRDPKMYYTQHKLENGMVMFLPIKTRE